MTEALTALGYEEAVLWVVPENERARALYDSEGWVADGAVSTEEVFGVTVTDIRYRKPLVASPPHAQLLFVTTHGALAGASSVLIFAGVRRVIPRPRASHSAAMSLL